MVSFKKARQRVSTNTAEGKTLVDNYTRAFQAKMFQKQLKEVIRHEEDPILTDCVTCEKTIRAGQVTRVIAAVQLAFSLSESRSFT